MGLQTREDQRMVVRMVRRRQTQSQGVSEQSLAEHYRHIKYTQLNSDVFTGIVDFDWPHIAEEYRKIKQVEAHNSRTMYTLTWIRCYAKQSACCLWRIGCNYWNTRWRQSRSSRANSDGLNQHFQSLDQFRSAR